MILDEKFIIGFFIGGMIATLIFALIHNYTLENIDEISKKYKEYKKNVH